MALERNDKCRHFMNGAYFDRCLIVYTGYYEGKAMSWEICVCADDLPPGTPSNPLHSDILLVADQKASDLYSAWLSSLPDLGNQGSSEGLGGVVIP